MRKLPDGFRIFQDDCFYFKWKIQRRLDFYVANWRQLVRISLKYQYITVHSCTSTVRNWIGPIQVISGSPLSHSIPGQIPTLFFVWSSKFSYQIENLYWHHGAIFWVLVSWSILTLINKISIKHFCHFRNDF